ncbi:MAG TPA: hypothetical protein VKR06_16085 [Ktedonosporobacter sp.]|nr:hypothetical protein [Ktedonosporobacter sp.]
MQNSTVQAKDGTHSLLISFNSSNSTDFPLVDTANMGTQPPKGGQTITAYVYLRQGSNVRVWLFAQDQNFGWYGSNTTVTLIAGTWQKVTFTLPSSMSGSAARLGLQMDGTGATIYLNDIFWA